MTAGVTQRLPACLGIAEAILASAPARAGVSAEELAKLAQNPVGNLITRTIIPLIWGAGPIIQFPANTSDLGNENWGLGPSARSSTSGSCQ